MPAPTARAPWLAPLVACLALAGCTTPAQPAVEVPTHTLAVAETAYAGHLEPTRTVKLTVAPDVLAVPHGAAVSAGQDLAGATEEARARAADVERLVAAYGARIDLANQALERLAQGGTVTHERDASLPAASVRAVEHDIVASLVAERRAAAQRKRDRAKLAAGGPDAAAEASYLRQDDQFARTELTNQLQAQFENLRAEATAARTEAEETLRTLRATAPFDGIVVVRGEEVWLQSIEASFVYIATEAQTDALTAADGLTLHVRSQRIGTLRLSSATFSAEATTNPQAPRYELRFAVDAERPFAPRERSTAALVQTTGALAIPEHYLGKDADGSYVLRGGERVGVQVTRDATGQYLLNGSTLTAGDRIERIAP